MDKVVSAGGFSPPRVDVLWAQLEEVDMAIERWQTDARVYLGHLLGNALFLLGRQGTGGVMENPLRHDEGRSFAFRESVESQGSYGGK